MISTKNTSNRWPFNVSNLCYQFSLDIVGHFVFSIKYSTCKSPGFGECNVVGCCLMYVILVA